MQFRIMPYGVTVGALALIFIIIEIVYIAQRKLLPGTMMLLSFILLVLFIAGIIGTAIQLFAGPNINNQCNTYVFNDSQDGPTLDTLAFLQQRNICKCFHVLKYNMGTNDYNRSMLAGRVRLLDRRKRVPDLDDGYGESGQFESVLVMIVKRLFSAKLWHFFVHFLQRVVYRRRCGGTDTRTGWASIIYQRRRSGMLTRYRSIGGHIVRR
jgi:hypothetical protein